MWLKETRTLGSLGTKMNYNIASRATQSNSVYVSVFKIPLVHADSVSKSIRRDFFFFLRERQLLARGKILYFPTIIDTDKQRLCPPVPKRRQFCDLFSWARVLKWGRKKRQRKRRLCISAVTIRFTEQSLLNLLSVFRVGFDAQFHRLCHKTIGSCF